MKTFLAALVLLLACSSLAYADGRGWGGHGPRPGWSGRPGGWGHGHHRDYGSQIGGNIIGGMIGSWMWNQFNQPAPPPPPPPEPVPDATQPWTPAWYEYCSQKYKTFDARTGYYNGLDGQRHFCQ
jgi:hypothetical protein